MVGRDVIVYSSEFKRQNVNVFTFAADKESKRSTVCRETARRHDLSQDILDVHCEHKSFRESSKSKNCSTFSI